MGRWGRWLGAGALLLGGMAMAWPAAGGESEITEAALRQQGESVHRNLWTRFMGPDHVLYDYAGLAGEVELPTPEECAQDKPNILGWWTPIENGGFFNGMYLTALCDRYALDPTPENRDRVLKAVRGLFRLQDVGTTPGFIARGIASDGKAHYAASSNDQVFPWLLGLWKFLKTDIPDAGLHAEVAGRMRRQGETLLASRWFIVGDRPGTVNGWFLGDGFCAAVHLLAATHFLHDATGDPKWQALYREYRDGKSPSGRARLETLERGMENLAYWSAWFNAVAQYALRELYRSETDPAAKEAYRRSLRVNAEKAAPLIPLYKKYDPAKTRVFTPDWRRMLAVWRPQANLDEARTLAAEQDRLWGRECPAVAEEKTTLKPAVCAALIVHLSDDAELMAAHWPETAAAVMHFDYDRAYYSAFFFVECLLNDRALGQAAKTAGQ